MRWLAAFSFFGAIAIAARWWLRRVDGLGRPRPKPLFSVGFLLVVALVSGWFAVRAARLEDRLSEAASVLARRAVRVHCQSIAGTFTDAQFEPGYVRFGPDGPEPETTIKPDQCRHLREYLSSSKDDPPFEHVLAVHLLTHEAMHMAGTMNEAKTECAAVQRDAAMARELGASPHQARALAERYWSEAYPRMPDRYTSDECRPGGALDESLGDGPWPAP